MMLDYGTTFLIDRQNGKNDGRLRLRLRWNKSKNHAAILIGFRIDPSKWNTNAQRCIANTTHGKNHTPASVINRTIQAYEDAAHSLFARYIRDNINPTEQEVRKDLRLALGKSTDEAARADISAYIDQFRKEQGSLNNWTIATHKKFITLSHHLQAYSDNPTYRIFTEAGLLGFVEYLRDRAKMRNTTITKQIRILKWFLRWSERKGYLHNYAYRDFSPRLRQSRNDIIYLDWGELLQVYRMAIPPSKQYLERVRDIFCFCCFTGLRYSDVQQLRPSDISGGAVHITTRKTGDRLTIELNDFSAAIAARYTEQDRQDGRLFPVISNQKMNDYLKELGAFCGIDTPVTRIYYSGSERMEETRPKWAYIGTHTARRTFISNAIIKGIPPQIVMKWTGHKDYSAMKPYIEVADRVKRDAMRAFNS